MVAHRAAHKSRDYNDTSDVDSQVYLPYKGLGCFVPVVQLGSTLKKAAGLVEPKQHASIGPQEYLRLVNCNIENIVPVGDCSCGVFSVENQKRHQTDQHEYHD